MEKNKQMKRALYLLLFALSTSTVSAQQLPFYSQYYYNPFLYNPAFTGTTENLNLNGIYRSQWNDIPGAPVTSTFTIDGPIQKNKAGLGLILYNHTTDIIDRLGANLSYSYRVKISESAGDIFFGLSMGLTDNRIDFNKVVANDLDDPMLLNQQYRKSAIDASSGISYVWNKLMFGFSIPQLLSNELIYQVNDKVTYYNLYRHYLVTGQYTFGFKSSKKIELTPLILLRAAPKVATQFDINTILNINDIVWFSLSYRSDYAVGIGTKFNIHKSLNIGYAYDILIGSMSSFGGTSHELMLGYTFGASKEKSEEEKLAWKRMQDQINSAYENLIDIEDRIAGYHSVEDDEKFKALMNEIDLINKELKKRRESKEEINSKIEILEQKIELLIKLIGG